MIAARVRALAARWADEERAAGREVAPQMQRRVAGALSRGGAGQLDSAEAWWRLSIWSRSQNLNRRRPPTSVLSHVIRSDDAAKYWAACLGEEGIK